MSKKGGGKVPAPPDPNVVAAAQTKQNQNSANYNAAINRTNTYTPYGSQEYTNTGVDPVTGAPIYRQDIKLGAQQQQQYDQQQGQNLQLGQAGGNLVNQINGQQPFSLSGLPAMSTDFDALRKSQTDALYKRNTDYLDPQFKQSEDALRSRMANQGIVEGSEASNNAVGDFNRGKEFSYGQARDSAIAGGGAEADRQFGMESQVRNQAMSEQLAQYQMPYQQLSQIRGLTGIDMPQFQGQAQVGTQPADIQGAYNTQYQGQLDAYNAKQQQKNQLIGGLFSLGGAALGGPIGGAIGGAVGKKVAGG